MQYVVLDFEATCDEPYNPDPQEIIEFPAVLIDQHSPDKVAEFHTFVRPAAHPLLTPFCRSLTGIRQDQVDRGISFPLALQQFDQWRQAHGLSHAPLVTCGDWDLGSLLPRQCRQHGLAIPEWANRWCNLKRVFAWNFPQAQVHGGLTDMAAALGVPLQGRLHSGIDDTRNIARLLRRMLLLGVVPTNTAFWRCLGCGAENLYRSRDCSRCQQPSVPLRPGDWGCPNCGFANFAQRDKCFDCGTRRPGTVSSAASQPRLKAGDWLCAECGEHNFARRDTCFKCARPRP